MTIAKKIRELSLAVVLCTAAALGLALVWGYGSLTKQLRVRSLQSRVETEARFLSSAFEELRHDVRLLGSLPQVHRVAAAPEAPDDPDLTRTKDQIAAVFMEMLRAKPSYFQVRLLSAEREARELVRVERRSGVLLRVAEKDLQNKGHRGYVQQSRQVNSNRVWLSDINLNREHGKVEIPYRATVRAILNIRTKASRTPALVVINQRFDTVIERITPANDTNFQYYITNSHGDYLVHPDRSKIFGFDVGHRFQLQTDAPALASMFSTPQRHSQVTELSSGALLAVQPVWVFGKDDDRFLGFGLAASADQITGPIKALAVRVLVLLLVMVSLALLAAYVVSERLARPLREITAASKQVAEGEPVGNLPLERNDEIGTLAASLSSMVRSLKDKEAELETTNSELRRSNKVLAQFAHIASHDLREPANRVAAMSDIVQQTMADSITEQAQMWLTRLKNNAQEVLRRVSDLRVFTEISDGRLTKEPVDIAGLLQEVIDEQTDASLKTSQFEPIQAYRAPLRVLLRELVGDAREHCPGQLQVELSSEEEAGELVWTFTTNATPRTDKGSPNLRLAICERVVSRHQGRLWFDQDSDGAHTRFTLQPRGD